MVAAVVVALDLATKNLAMERLSFLKPYWVLKGWLYLQLSVNRGALFGLLPGWGYAFVIASVVAILFVLFLFRHTERRWWGTQIILGLIIGGALGNLYDRIFCIADIASPGTELELRGRIIDHDPATGLYTIGSFPDGRERLGQAPGPVETQPIVRDFIKIDVRLFGFQLWRWVFNLADVALTVGILWLLAISLRRHRQPRPTGE